MSKQSMKAVIRCTQPIPCNPCETACKRGAIHVGDDISSLPVLDEANCTGCGLCAAACPGIAIRLLGSAGENGRATVAIPYEYLPLPKEGQTLRLTDKNGQFVGEGTLQRITRPLKDDPTCLLYIETSPELAEKTHGIEREAAHG